MVSSLQLCKSFEESDEPLSERKNIIVMTDEAHRVNMVLKKKLMSKQERFLSGLPELYIILCLMLHILDLPAPQFQLRTEIQ